MQFIIIQIPLCTYNLSVFYPLKDDRVSNQCDQNTYNETFEIINNSLQYTKICVHYLILFVTLNSILLWLIASL